MYKTGKGEFIRLDTHVIDGSGDSGTSGVAGPAATGTFVSGVLTVIVVVPPRTVDVIRRVIVLVGLCILANVQARVFHCRTYDASSTVKVW
jgi:hypothetical protein